MAQVKPTRFLLWSVGTLAVVAIAMTILWQKKMLGSAVEDGVLESEFFNNTVAIQGPYAKHTLFCGVDSDSKPLVNCKGEKVTKGHLFEVEKTKDCSHRNDGKLECQFALKNKLTGKYCRDTGDALVCDASETTKQTNHAFIKQDGPREFSFPGAKSGKNRKACKDMLEKIACTGKKEDYSASAIFRYVPGSELGFKEEEEVYVEEDMQEEDDGSKKTKSKKSKKKKRKADFWKAIEDFFNSLF